MDGHRTSDTVVSEQDSVQRQRGLGEYGCAHYRRRVKFVAPCCGLICWCRHCHDEEKNRDEPVRVQLSECGALKRAILNALCLMQDLKKRHEIVRKDITHVVCALCDTKQPVGHYCTSCGVSFGQYSCTVCPFYDDNIEKEPFHCDECGICRVGGRANFFHCATCGGCYATSLKGKHVCVERALHQNCPVCFEYQFESVEPNTVLKCGHTIHAHCLEELERSTANICPCCPICKKSLGDYSSYWAALDREIENNPVPEEYAGWEADIMCNDCSTKSTQVPFHLIGLKCSSCGSYNTQRLFAGKR